MSSRSKANSLLAPCFAEKKTNQSIGTPEPLTVCLQQTIDLSTLSPKQFVRGTRAHLLLLLHPLLHFLKKIAMANSLFQSMDGRRIQAAINCSFFLSQNQIEQKKLLPETVVFFVFLIYFSQRIIFRPSSKL